MGIGENCGWFPIHTYAKKLKKWVVCSYPMIRLQYLQVVEKRLHGVLEDLSIGNLNICEVTSFSLIKDSNFVPLKQFLSIIVLHLWDLYSTDLA